MTGARAARGPLAFFAVHFGLVAFATQTRFTWFGSLDGPRVAAAVPAQIPPGPLPATPNALDPASLLAGPPEVASRMLAFSVLVLA